MNNHEFIKQAKDISSRYFKGSNSQLKFVLTYLSYDKTIVKALEDLHKKECELKDALTNIQKDKTTLEPISKASLGDKQIVENLARYLSQSTTPINW